MAAVNVSTTEEDNFLTELEVDIADRDEDDEDDDEEDDDALPKGTYKTIYVDLDVDPDPDAPLN